MVTEEAKLFDIPIYFIGWEKLKDGKSSIGPLMNWRGFQCLDGLTACLTASDREWTASLEHLDCKGGTLWLERAKNSTIADLSYDQIHKD